MRLVAADASTVRFGLRASHVPRAALADQIAFGLFLPGSELMLAAALHSVHDNERQMLFEQLHRLCSTDLLLLARGYPCRWLVAVLNQHNIRFCMRVEKSGTAGFTGVTVVGVESATVGGSTLTGVARVRTDLTLGNIYAGDRWTFDVDPGRFALPAALIAPFNLNQGSPKSYVALDGDNNGRAELLTLRGGPDAPFGDALFRTQLSAAGVWETAQRLQPLAASASAVSASGGSRLLLGRRLVRDIVALSNHLPPERADGVTR